MNLSPTAAAAGLKAITDLFNNGTLVFYSGALPATPQTAPANGNVVLATFTYSAQAYAASTFAVGFVSSVASFLSNTVSPVANGTVTWARAFRADGVTPIQDYTVATNGADITVANSALQTSIQVQISSLSEKLPAVG